MARPERKIDPQAGPVPRFAHELRELRNRAGSPTYREMQAKSYVSYSSLSRAAAGKRLPTWPVTRGFVLACGGDPEEWQPRWEAARASTADQSRWPFDRADPVPLPDPAAVRTVAELHAAVADILRHHDLGVISATMRVPLSTVRLLGRWPEQVDLPTFRSFLQACGAGEKQTRAWVAAWQAVVDELPEQESHLPDPDSMIDVQTRRDLLVTATAGSRSPGVDAPPVEPAPRRTLPDPSKADSYEELVCALRTLRAAAGVSSADIESLTGGRLGAHRVAAILSGVLPASGEELVLLLRACGLREEIDQWVDAWLRLDGSILGSAEPAAGLRWPRPGAPGPIVLVAALVLIGLLAAALAWLV